MEAYTPMENSTTNISPNKKNTEVQDVNNQKVNESLDAIAFYLFEAIKRKSNQELQRKGA